MRNYQMFKKLIFSFIFAALFLACRHSASASQCSIPYVFSNGQTASATQVNANFSAFATCGNSVDNTQIGTLGIYASQIIPTTIGQAVFGGSVAYKFSNGLTVLGGLTLGTALSVPNGGTGATGYTTGALLYFNGSAFVSASVASPLSFSGGSLSCAGCSGSGITAVTASSPLTSSGGTTPNIVCSTCAVTNANNNFSTAQTWAAPSATCGSAVPCKFTWSIVL